MMFGKREKNALKTSSHQNSFVGTVFTRMSPHPQVGFLGFVFVFWGAFHVTSISVFISYLFHFQVYHGKCTDFFVNNVLGFAKKEDNNKKKPF